MQVSSLLTFHWSLPHYFPRKAIDKHDALMVIYRRWQYRQHEQGDDTMENRMRPLMGPNDETGHAGEWDINKETTAEGTKVRAEWHATNAPETLDVFEGIRIRFDMEFENLPEGIPAFVMQETAKAIGEIMASHPAHPTVTITIQGRKKGA